MQALNCLDKSSITEIAAFANPPKMVLDILTTACTVVENQKTDWLGVKRLLK